MSFNLFKMIIAFIFVYQLVIWGYQQLIGSGVANQLDSSNVYLILLMSTYNIDFIIDIYSFVISHKLNQLFVDNNKIGKKGSIVFQN